MALHLASGDKRQRSVHPRPVRIRRGGWL